MQGIIRSWAHTFQRSNHGEDVGGNIHTCASQSLYIESAVSIQRFFQKSHGVQGFSIGLQQSFEMEAPALKLLAQGVKRVEVGWGGLGSAKAEQLGECVPKKRHMKLLSMSSAMKC
ncbi:hypothetical protein [Megalodesulfovibrio paquesii]